MQLKYLSLAAFASAASAQMMNLTSALSSTPDLSNLTTYISLFPDIISSLSMAKNVTLLAPSNEAFAKAMNMSGGISANDTGLISSVLMYHVLNGTYMANQIMETPMFIHTMLMNSTYSNVTGGQVVEAVSMNNTVMFYSGLLMNSTVTKADMNFTGGVIHIVDSLLTMPQNISTTAVAANLTSATGALMSAGIVETLDDLMDVTVFVPNNEAFTAIGSALPNMTKEQLTSILEYHVVNGTVGYSSMLSNMSLMTMGGMNVTISMSNGSVFVNSAKVVTPNVLVANGVVHVIDNVLNPNNTMAMPNMTESTQMPAFSGASTASGGMVPFTSGVMMPTSMIATATGAGGVAGAGTTSGASGAKSTSSKAMAAGPMITGAIGAAALFAAGAAGLNV